MVYKYTPADSNSLASYTFNYNSIVYKSTKYGDCFNLGTMNPLDFISPTSTNYEMEYILSMLVM